MWDCALFSQQTMTELTTKPEGDKTYTNAFNFFNKKVRNLEAYEAANRNKTSFDAANTAVELTKLFNSHKANNNAAAAALQECDKEHVLAMKEQNTPTKSLLQLG